MPTPIGATGQHLKLTRRHDRRAQDARERAEFRAGHSDPAGAELERRARTSSATRPSSGASAGARAAETKSAPPRRPAGRAARRDDTRERLATELPPCGTGPGAAVRPRAE